MNKFITALTVVLLFITTLPVYAWTVGKPAIDPLRGTIEVATGFVSENYLTSIVIRCENNRTTMYISHSDDFFPDSSEVIYKINDGPVRTHFARAAASYDALFITDPIPMIRHMLEGGEKGTMIIEFELEYYSNVQTTFTLYNRYRENETLIAGIKPVREACNW